MPPFRRTWMCFSVTCCVLLTAVSGLAPAGAEPKEAPEHQTPADNNEKLETQVDTKFTFTSANKKTFDDVRSEALEAETKLRTQLKHLDSLSQQSRLMARTEVQIEQFTKLSQSRQGGLAALAMEIRELPASMSVDELEIYEVDGKFAFAMPGVEIVEFHDSSVSNRRGEVVAEKIGMLQEKGPKMDTATANTVAVSAGRSFGLIRKDDGFYSWRSGDLGRVRIYWSKDWVEDSNGFNNSPDWMFYSAYTEAQVWDEWWEERWIYDVDTINGVTTKRLL